MCTSRTTPIWRPPVAGPLVSAGDVERFVYCAHNWWLAREGHDGSSEESMRGVEGHARIGQALQRAEDHRMEKLASLRWAFRILLVLGAICVATIASLTFNGDEPESWILITTGLVLLNCSVGLATIALYEDKLRREIQLESGLVPGKLIDEDLAGEGQLLQDRELGLAGRPDYVLETASGNVVPIEVKTGRTPRRPHDSHRLQLAAYMRLLEVNGRKPEYGILSYPGGSFRVAWDAEMRDRLAGIVLRMSQARADGIANRDHEHPARCAGCARRDSCTQRLS